MGATDAQPIASRGICEGVGEDGAVRRSEG